MNGSDFRIFYEQFAIKKLAKYLNVNPNDFKHLTISNPISAYDFEFNGIRYDAKYSSPSSLGTARYMPIWDFSLRKIKNGKRSGHDYSHCDFFICIGLLNGIPKKIFLIPAKEAPTNHIRISIKGESKYNKYAIL